MSQIDTVKSQITSLRYMLSVMISMLFIGIGTFVSDCRADTIDIFTYLSVSISLLSLALSIITQNVIGKKSNELKDL